MTTALNIAGFWRRAGAFVVDTLLLSILGWILGALFYATFAKMGSYGRAIGFFVEMAYFVPLDSRLGRGQTWGKRLLGLQVVDADGQCLSMPRTLLRYAVLGVPFYLNGFFLPAPGSNSAALIAVSSVISLIVFGGLLSLCYLYLFNRHTRQSLHDLAARSYVVRTHAQSTRSLQPVWHGHLIVVGLIGLLSLAAPLVFSHASAALTTELAKLQPAWRQLEMLPNVQHAQLTEGSANNNGQQIYYMSVTLWLNVPDENDEALAKDAARTVASHNATDTRQDLILVQLIYGYDIGIASTWRKRAYRFNPKELQALADQNNPANPGD